ncbi:hypothetical protein GFJ94_00245 [Flavobacterium sp. LMO8]|uniref:hypothetical protein n=1 Tax=Flavobacterium sp. LMO8 TaxID=2654244 RepID=UPI0012925F99|nr:hypothetical protein [Flavobacterium sp. LMO8]MQP23494.1 hypothetical protein [Flavobacterium sp. LMO8]
MKQVISLVILFLVQFINAQEATIGEINNVKKSGLQLVLLSPEVISEAENNTNFIRVANKKSRAEVPYAVYSIPETIEKSFVSFPLVSKTKNDSVTSIVVSNVKEQQLNELFIMVSNSSVSKLVNVFGSNDGKEWFGLVQNHLLTNFVDPKLQQVEKAIVLPLNNYKFLKLDLNNKVSLPIECKNFGIYQSKVNYVAQLELKNFNQKIIADNSKKKSLILVSFEKPQLISRLDFYIRSDLYFRTARILVNRERKVKNKIEKYQVELFTFVLNSKMKTSFEFPEIFENEFIIEIDNQDNPPLEIEKLQLFQTSKYILANLEQGEKYEIAVSNKLEKPNYDIVNFLPKENEMLEVVTIENFKPIKSFSKVEQIQLFWQTKWFLWTAIIVAGLIISYFALGLLKEVEKKD